MLDSSAGKDDLRSKGDETDLVLEEGFGVHGEVISAMEVQGVGLSWLHVSVGVVDKFLLAVFVTQVAVAGAEF